MHFVRAPTLVAVVGIFAISCDPIGRSVDAKPSSGCKYWCKDGNKYYCCTSGKKKNDLLAWVMETILEMSDNPWMYYLLPVISLRDFPPDSWMMRDKPPRTCPDIRPFCPRSYEWPWPPVVCNTDDECTDSDKCCYDVCLEHKICKPSSTATS